ncbi:MAG: pre-peptidase C-terminal domain-containing protein [Promethearchaeota archaeon]
MKSKKLLLLILLVFIPILAMNSVNKTYLEINTKDSKETITRNEVSFPKTANIPLYIHTFDDPTAESFLDLHHTNSSSYQRLQIQYDYGSDIIVTGINFKHRDFGSGDNNLNITVICDEGSQSYTSVVPHSSSITWFQATFQSHWIIDDNPAITLASSEDFSTCMQIGADTPASGDSYYDNEGTSGWVVSSSYEYLCELRFENIDSLSSGSSDTGSIRNEDYVDAYTVSMGPGLEYIFTMQRTDGTTGDLNMRLLEYSQLTTGTVLNSTTGNSQTETMRYSPSKSSTYLLLIEPNTPDTDYANYSITFEINDKYEENDDYSSAAAITEGEHTQLWCADDDWYKINVASGNDITVRMDYEYFFDGGLDLDLFATGPIRVRDTWSQGANFKEIGYTVTSTDDFYIRVNKTGSYSNDYNLTITINSSAPTDDSYEENDHYAQAKLISEGRYNNLKCWDDDWFYFYVSSGVEINITIEFTHANGNIDMCAYNPGISLIGNSSSTTDNENIVHITLTAGYYSIFIYKKTPADNNDYNLIVEIEDDDDFEENDDYGNAKQVAEADYKDLKCWDADWYYISLDKDELITVTIYFSHSEGDLDIKLYTEGPNQVNISESGSDNEKVSYSASNSGNIYIQVYKFASDDNNVYNMNIDILNPPDPGNNEDDDKNDVDDDDENSNQNNKGVGTSFEITEFIISPIGIMIIAGSVAGIMVPLVISKMKSNQEYRAIKKESKKKDKLNAKYRKETMKTRFSEEKQEITELKDDKKVKEKRKHKAQLDLSLVNESDDNNNDDWEWDDFF